MMLGAIITSVGLFVYAVGVFLDARTTSQFDGKWVYEKTKRYKKADGTARVKQYVLEMAVAGGVVALSGFVYFAASFPAAVALVYFGVRKLQAAGHNQALLNQRKREHGF